MRQRAFLFGGLFVLLALTRLCHSDILWTDGDYHLAAAMHLLSGKALYRDIWYDKPPLNALLFAGLGAPTGWKLALAEAVWGWLGCVLAFLTARKLGGERAGFIAAALAGFFLTFYLPASVISLAPDLIMLVPHLAAVYFAISRRPLIAGVCAGLAFWANAKGLFVLLVCGIMAPADALLLIVGFLIPAVVAVAGLAASGSLSAYVEQVWRWGVRYAASSPDATPLATGLMRTANWLGFHAALVLGAALYWARTRTAIAAKLALWTLVSFGGVCLGLRFAPRYYFELLAPLVVIAALGLSVRGPKWVTPVLLVMLAVPLVRFGPRYGRLMLDDTQHREHQWSDIALDQDNRRLADIVTAQSHAGDTIFVWGYRPGIYVYTRLLSPSRYWDSQPLDGVPADRHLQSAAAIDDAGARENRVEFSKTAPTFVVDGLSQLNPQLAISRYPELADWLSRYEDIGGTAISRVYKLKKP